MGMYNDPNGSIDRTSKKYVRLFLILLSVIIGSIVFFAVYFLTEYFLIFLSQLPFLRYILFFPSDAGWATIVIPSSTAVFCAAMVSSKIAKTSVPMMILLVIYWIASIIGLITGGNFRLSFLLAYLCGLVTCFICFNSEK